MARGDFLFMKEKVIIFGTGSTGERIYEEVKNLKEVLGFLDNDQLKWGGRYCGLPVFGNAKHVSEIFFDKIIVASLTGVYVIRDELLNECVPADKIDISYVETQVQARLNFLKDYSSVIDADNVHAVAEGGVFQGEFAKEINRYFPNARLYLFDTFEGFDERDLAVEVKNNYSEKEVHHLHITTEQMVLDKLPYPQMAIVRKGFFPETAKDLPDEIFTFVNLDFDLYNPILEGLRYFYPRMRKNAVMLVHDYFNPGYKGVAEAVRDYEREIGKSLCKFPIGDHCSIAIAKV